MCFTAPRYFGCIYLTKPSQPGLSVTTCPLFFRTIGIQIPASDLRICLMAALHQMLIQWDGCGNGRRLPGLIIREPGPWVLWHTVLTLLQRSAEELLPSPLPTYLPTHPPTYLPTYPHYSTIANTTTSGRNGSGVHEIK